MIGLGVQGYHEVNSHLPPAVVRDKAGRPLYSWRVALLPYVEKAGSMTSFTRTNRGTVQPTSGSSSGRPAFRCPSLATTTRWGQRGIRFSSGLGRRSSVTG
ncbi:DUF1559 family PulG-like putative transporter [Limnoglobus roseus]|uniref:DUF1559 family PulG-like putative transporter n=1 Tax=Limnoglobus roseus TaxID=2598579 RepID=UPI0036F23C10